MVPSIAGWHTSVSKIIFNNRIDLNEEKSPWFLTSRKRAHLSLTINSFANELYLIVSVWCSCRVDVHDHIRRHYLLNKSELIVCLLSTEYKFYTMRDCRTSSMDLEKEECFHVNLFVEDKVRVNWSNNLSADLFFLTISCFVIGVFYFYFDDLSRSFSSLSRSSCAYSRRVWLVNKHRRRQLTCIHVKAGLNEWINRMYIAIVIDFTVFWMTAKTTSKKSNNHIYVKKPFSEVRMLVQKKVCVCIVLDSDTIIKRRKKIFTYVRFSLFNWFLYKCKYLITFLILFKTYWKAIIPTWSNDIDQIK